jgi:hypothetical protein
LKNTREPLNNRRDFMAVKVGGFGGDGSAGYVAGSVGISLVLSSEFGHVKAGDVKVTAVAAEQHATGRGRPAALEKEALGRVLSGVVVDSVLFNSPAHACITKGDELIAVDGTPVAGLSLFAVESLMFGLAGTRLSLTLGRKETATHLSSLARPPQRVFSVLLVRAPDRQMQAQDKLDIFKAMHTSAAQVWSQAKFSVMEDEQELHGLALPHLAAAWGKGKVTRQSLIMAPEAGIDTWTQLSHLPDILLLLQRPRLADEGAVAARGYLPRGYANEIRG